MDTAKVNADKIRAGDVIAFCRDQEPSVTVGVAEYYGYRNGLNCVRIGFEREGGKVEFMYRPGWRARGIYAPSDTFYVSTDDAETIRLRPPALDEFYGRVVA